MQQGNTELALQQFLELKEQHDQAGVKIAEIKFQIAETSLHNNDTEKGLAQLQEVFEVQKNIQRSSLDKAGLKSIERKASSEVAKIHFQKANIFLKNKQRDLANESFEEALKWYSSLDGFSDVKHEIHKELSKLHYDFAVEKEHKKDFEKCLINYKTALSYLSWFASETIFYDSELK